MIGDLHLYIAFENVSGGEAARRMKGIGKAARRMKGIGEAARRMKGIGNFRKQAGEAVQI